MKCTVPAVLVLAVGLVVSLAATMNATSKKALAGEPAEKESEPAEKAPADNNTCLECHDNFEKERLASEHAKEGVGCVDCHGESTAHAEDENQETAPERMYSPDTIATGCGECHETHNASAKRILARWKARKLTEKDPAKLLCTDCHGRHRLAERTIRWDHNTGKPIFKPKANAKKQ